LGCYKEKGYIGMGSSKIGIISNTIYWGSCSQEKLKISGINQLPCTVDVSNDVVNIKVLKNYRYAKTITAHQTLQR